MAAPVITIYKNGDSYYHGKRLVLNRKEIRNFDAFLDRVTKDISSKVAVRSIRTPSHGHRVGNLDKLENGGIYVAVGPERFKKLEYKEVSSLPTHRQKPPEQIIKPVVHSRVIVSGRARKVAAAETSANKTIFVYRNGDDKHAAFKILLDKRMLHTNMNTILQFITEKVNLRTGAVKSLYTLDGLEISEPPELKSMEKYVAVGFGKKFLKMAYNENGTNSSTPRRGGPKIKSTSSEPPFRKKKQKPPVKAMSQGHVKSPPKAEETIDNFQQTRKDSEEKQIDSTFDQPKEDENDSSLTRGITQDLTQSASRASTKHDSEAANEEPENSAVQEAPPNKHIEKEANAKSDRKKSDAVAKKKQSRAKKSISSDVGSVKAKNEDEDKKTDDVEEEDNANYDSESTVFKATGNQAESASAINENKETTVDKPIDMVPAAEVEEELEDGEKEAEENETHENEDKKTTDEPEEPVGSNSPQTRDSLEPEKEADDATVDNEVEKK